MVLFKWHGQTASAKQLLHFAQMASQGLKQFDYGDAAANRAKYGSDKPPAIDLDQINQNIPIAFFKGTKDELADLRDVRWAQQKLGRRLVKYKLISEFDHSGFAVGKKTAWIEDVLGLLETYK